MRPFAALSLAIWLFLLLFRGRFWWIRPARWRSLLPDAAPRIAAVIPARDEAEHIGTAIRSLLSQKYLGPLAIFVVDDQSRDGTAAIARGSGPAPLLTVIAGRPLPAGWTGKLWAVSQGIAAAESFRPDYFLLTDADIEHAPGELTTLAAEAGAGNWDLVSLMARLHCAGTAEKALIPAFVYFFFKLYPPRWIADPRCRTAGAAGGCMLLRAAALERIGGISAIRGALIDDCALAGAVKRSGGRVLLGAATETRSLRPYGGWRGIGRMISRTAFTQLRYSPLLLLATIAGMAVAYMAPPVLALRGSPAAIAAWLLMTVSYVPVLRYYRLNPLWALALPLAAFFYTGATIYSACEHWRGRGGEWKGRYSS